MAAKAHCVSCRSDIDVPDTYAHGDHIKCGSCGTQHKVLRGEGVRLVIADAAPLKEALKMNQAMVERLEQDLRAARGSLGIGVHGLGLAVAYVIWQVGLEDRSVGSGLILEAAAVAVLTGLLLEVANFLFLAKRKAMSRLSDELEEARAEGRQIQQRIREASRV